MALAGWTWCTAPGPSLLKADMIRLLVHNCKEFGSWLEASCAYTEMIEPINSRRLREPVSLQFSGSRIPQTENTVSLGDRIERGWIYRSVDGFLPWIGDDIGLYVWLRLDKLPLHTVQQVAGRDGVYRASRTTDPLCFHNVYANKGSRPPQCRAIVAK